MATLAIDGTLRVWTPAAGAEIVETFLQGESISLNSGEKLLVVVNSAIATGATITAIPDGKTIAAGARSFVELQVTNSTDAVLTKDRHHITVQVSPTGHAAFNIDLTFLGNNEFGRQSLILRKIDAAGNGTGLYFGQYFGTGKSTLSFPVTVVA